MSDITGIQDAGQPDMTDRQKTDRARVVNLDGGKARIARFGYAHFTVMANGFAETPPPMLERNAKNLSLL